MPDALAFVVEDDRDIAYMYSVTLKLAGFQTEICYDGQSALDRLAETTPRLIVLDLNLPRANGVTVLQTMRGDPRLEHIPVIVATGNPQMATEICDLAQVVLIKPVGYEQFLDMALRFK